MKFTSPYRRIFIEHNGPGPWPCYWHKCNEVVALDQFVVHHIDHNHKNDEVTNLAAMHQRCHGALHATGVVISEETRRRQRDAKLGRKHTAEARAKIGASLRGRPVSLETRAKLREVQLGRKYTNEDRAKMSASAKARWARRVENQ